MQHTSASLGASDGNTDGALDRLGAGETEGVADGLTDRLGLLLGGIDGEELGVADTLGG